MGFQFVPTEHEIDDLKTRIVHADNDHYYLAVDVEVH